MKYTYKETVRDKNKVEYEVNVDFKELEQFKEEVFSELSKTVKMDGFRPGKVPKDKVEQKLGGKLITESIGRLLPRVAYEIMQKEEDRPVHAPEYDLKKADEKEGILFTFQFVNYPEVKLGDFKKIKIKREVEPVNDEDIEAVVKNIVRSSIPPQKIKELTEVIEVKPKNTKKDDSKEEKKEEEVRISDFKLNDKLVEALGYENEKTLKDINKAVRERLEQLKEEQANNAYTSKVIEEAIKLSKFEIPDMFIENEAGIYEDQFNSRLEELKLDRDTYLATQGTDIEKKKEEWKKQAIEKISVDLVLISLANEHNTVAEEKDIDEEIEKIADPEVKKQYRSESAREYVRSVITRQRGLSKLIEIVGAPEAKKK